MTLESGRKRRERTMRLAPGARLGSYEILSLVGAGGMGEVYRARDTRLNRDIALKTLLGSFRPTHLTPRYRIGRKKRLRLET